MTSHLITLASDDMMQSARVCVRSALDHGVNYANAYPRSSLLLDTDFYSENKALLDAPRGCGYWAWKPWLIYGAIDLCQFEADKDNTDDILIYSDAGVEFINNVSHIIDRMDQDIFLFGNNWEHAHWCKADIVDEVWPLDEWPWADEWAEEEWSRFGKQVQASVIFFRVTDYTRKFVKEWLDWCLFEGGRLIDDSPSRTPNHPEFQENRHDQAILTTMAYREGIKLHWWPAIYNDGQFTYQKLPVYAEDNYPPIFHHHRRRNHEWSNAA